MNQKFSKSIQDCLEKAYSSQMHLERRSNAYVVIKKVSTRERKNEIFFHEQMCRAGLPSMIVHEEGENLVLDYIKNAKTLGDQETEKNYYKFGQAVKSMHQITFNSPMRIDESAHQVSISWKDFIQNILGQKHNQSGFDKQIIFQSVKLIKDSKIENSNFASLLHGDLHANNILLKNGKIIIFDKGDQIAAGDPLYDLALITINLPGAVFNLGKEIDHDKLLLKAFIKGYEIDFTKDKKKLDAYTLLRSIERWPNPFEKEIPDIVTNILNSNI